MRFSSLRVSTRLGLAFGLVLLMSAVSGGLALNRLRAIEDNLQDVVTDNNVKIRHSSEMSDALHVASRTMRTAALLDDKAQQKAELDKLGASRQRYDQAFEALSRMPASEAGKALRAQIAAARDAARPLNDRFVALATAGNIADASTVLLGQAIPATQKWQDLIRENIRLQEADTQRLYQEAEADYAAARNLLIGTNLAALVLAALLARRVTRSITGALGGEPEAAAEVAKRVASGDLGTPVPVRAGDAHSLMAQLQAMQASLRQVVATVRHNADSVATASAQIAQGNQDLSQRTEEQASALQQTAASMEQLGATVRHNTDNARQASTLAGQASDVARQGGEVVGQVVDTMKGIQDSSHRIADIIGVIDGIAFQTNILALNAAVEAARAGEQGRGFAVVAGEVRSLAQRSAEAAREIKGLITASVERVEHGTALVDRAGATMAEVVSSIRHVADLMGEVNNASAEQSAGVGQVGQAIGAMDQTTQQNAALVEESAAAAESLRAQAQQLVQTVAVFRV